MGESPHMNSILILAILGLILPVVGESKTDKDREQLVGPVRSVKSQKKRYADKSLLQEIDVKESDTVIYDQAGNEVERTIFDDYGFLAGKETHAHLSGKRKESVLKDPKGQTLERRVYNYTGDKLIQIDTFEGGRVPQLRLVSSYGSDSLVDQQTYYAKKRILGKTVYKYDDLGRLSEVAFYRADGKKAVAPIGPCLNSHRITYTYDSQGKPLKVVSFEPDGELKKSWLYVYDEKGQVKEQVQESHGYRVSFESSYEYDSRGNWIKDIVTTHSQSDLIGSQSHTSFSVITRQITYY
jgi:hypothetical protein